MLARALIPAYPFRERLLYTILRFYTYDKNLIKMSEKNLKQTSLSKRSDISLSNTKGTKLLLKQIK